MGMYWLFFDTNLVKFWFWRSYSTTIFIRNITPLRQPMTDFVSFCGMLNKNMFIKVVIANMV